MTIDEKVRAYHELQKRINMLENLVEKLNEWPLATLHGDCEYKEIKKKWALTRWKPSWSTAYNNIEITLDEEGISFIIQYLKTLIPQLIIERDSIFEEEGIYYEKWTV